MGLETAHPEILSRLNKRMTLEQFAEAARGCGENDMDLRVFVLVKPPFITERPEALHWAERSIDFAFDCGATRRLADSHSLREWSARTNWLFTVSLRRLASVRSKLPRHMVFI